MKVLILSVFAFLFAGCGSLAQFEIKDPDISASDLHVYVYDGVGVSGEVFIYVEWLGQLLEVGATFSGAVFDKGANSAEVCVMVNKSNAVCRDVGKVEIVSFPRP